MSVNWNTFEQNLINAINNRQAKDEDSFGDLIANEYDKAVLHQAQDLMIGNRLLSANKSILASSIKTAFRLAKLARTQSEAQNTMRSFINTGIIAYWTGAQLDITIPPPGAVKAVTNNVTFPGIPPDVKITNSSSPETMAKEMSSRFRIHLLTVKALTTGVTANGSPVPPLTVNGLN